MTKLVVSSATLSLLVYALVSSGRAQAASPSIPQNDLIQIFEISPGYRKSVPIREMRSIRMYERNNGDFDISMQMPYEKGFLRYDSVRGTFDEFLVANEYYDDDTLDPESERFGQRHFIGLRDNYYTGDIPLGKVPQIELNGTKFWLLKSSYLNSTDTHIVWKLNVGFTNNGKRAQEFSLVAAQHRTSREFIPLTELAYRNKLYVSACDNGSRQWLNQNDRSFVGIIHHERLRSQTYPLSATEEGFSNAHFVLGTTSPTAVGVKGDQSIVLRPGSSVVIRDSTAGEVNKDFVLCREDQYTAASISSNNASFLVVNDVHSGENLQELPLTFAAKPGSIFASANGNVLVCAYPTEGMGTHVSRFDFVGGEYKRVFRSVEFGMSLPRHRGKLQLSDKGNYLCGLTREGFFTFRLEMPSGAASKISEKEGFEFTRLDDLAFEDQIENGPRQLMGLVLPDMNLLELHPRLPIAVCKSNGSSEVSILNLRDGKSTACQFYVGAIEGVSWEETHNRIAVLGTQGFAAIDINYPNSGFLQLIPLFRTWLQQIGNDSTDVAKILNSSKLGIKWLNSSEVLIVCSEGVVSLELSDDGPRINFHKATSLVAADYDTGSESLYILKRDGELWHFERSSKREIKGVRKLKITLGPESRLPDLSKTRIDATNRRILLWADRSVQSIRFDALLSKHWVESAMRHDSRITLLQQRDIQDRDSSLGSSPRVFLTYLRDKRQYAAIVFSQDYRKHSFLPLPGVVRYLQLTHDGNFIVARCGDSDDERQYVYSTQDL